MRRILGMCFGIFLDRGGSVDGDLRPFGEVEVDGFDVGK